MDAQKDKSMEQLILEAAEVLFLEKGFSLTSTTEIAKTVGCNQALVHYYYRTKEHLFNVIFEQKFMQFFQSVFDNNSLHDLAFEDKIKLIMNSHVDMLQKNPKLPQLIINELARQPERIDKLKEKLRSYPEKVFAELNQQLRTEILHGKVRNINLLDLFITIVTLNVSLFMYLPLMQQIFGLNEDQKTEFIAHRRIENIDFVLNSIRP